VAEDQDAQGPSERVSDRQIPPQDNQAQNEMVDCDDYLIKEMVVVKRASSEADPTPDSSSSYNTNINKQHQLQNINLDSDATRILNVHEPDLNSSSKPRLH
jgi:hypothetical protein